MDGEARGATRVGVRVLGRFRVEGPSATLAVRGEQPALVLARLILDRPAALERDELVDLLWPDRVPAHWEGAARKVVTRARAVLTATGTEPERLVSTHGTIALDLDGLTVDVDLEAVARQVDAADDSLERSAWSDGEQACTLALDAVRAGFFARSGTEWVDAWIGRVDRLEQRALLTLARAALGAGHVDRALTLGSEAKSANPSDERVTRLLMRAHVAAGNRAAGLAEYEDLRRWLDDSLGVRPSSETEALFVATLGEAPDPGPPYPTAAPPVDRPVRAVPPRLPFVGRNRERASIDAALDAVGAGTSSTIVVIGDPGIGKSRLASELAGAARAKGFTALVGSSRPDSAEPMEPFVEIVGSLVRADRSLVERIGGLASDLARVLPEVGDWTPGPRPSSTDDLARRRVAQAIVRTMELAAADPVLIVLDDLQWISPDARTVLSLLLDRLRSTPAVLLLLMRDTATSRRILLGDLSRVADVALRLGGLDAGEIATLVRASGAELPEDVDRLVAEIVDRTGGNPLYVSQLLRAAQVTGRPVEPDVPPDALAHLLEARLETLGRDCRDVLTLAAVCGHDFEARTVESCLSLPSAAVLDAMDTLVEERFLDETGVGTFRFAHELVRDAVLTSVGATRRAGLHRRVAGALVEAHSPARTIALHLRAAGDEAASAAYPWLLRAGDEALWRASWAEALDLFSEAERVAPTAADRAAPLVGRGRARRGLGDAALARADLEAARALARAQNRARDVAAATLRLVGGGGRGVAVDLADAERAALLREALTGLTDADADLLVPLLGELALALVLTDARAERDALCERALAVAHAHGDPELIATALLTRRVARMGPSGTVGRLQDAHEVLAFPPDVVTAQTRIAGHLAAVEDAFELGRRSEVDDHLDAATRAAEEIGHPYWRWAATSWQALVAAIDGDVERAEQLAQEALGHQAPESHPEALAALAVQTVLFRLLQGRAGEVVPLLVGAADAYPQIPCYRAVLALCQAESGDGAAAAAVLRWFAERDYELPADSNWLLGTAVLADAAATVGDVAAAAALRDRLAPWEDRHVVLNCYGAGGSAWGPVAIQLGRCSAVLGEADAAAAYARAAREAVVAFGAPALAGRVAAPVARPA